MSNASKENAYEKDRLVSKFLNEDNINQDINKGELEKTVTFKEKVRLQPENVNAGLLTYPVLQAADIIIQRAVKVPVGKDQEQHLEMARNFANRFNHRYGDVFPEPQAFNFNQILCGHFAYPFPSFFSRRLMSLLVIKVTTK